MTTTKRASSSSNGDATDVMLYRNVTENEVMVFTLYGDEDQPKPVVVKPGEVFYVSKRDLRRHAKDVRFTEGRVVPESAESQAMAIMKADNVMTDAEIRALVARCQGAEELAERIKDVTVVSTLRRIRKECSDEGQDKPMSFVRVVDAAIERLLQEAKA